MAERTYSEIALSVRLGLVSISEIYHLQGETVG